MTVDGGSVWNYNRHDKLVDYGDEKMIIVKLVNWYQLHFYIEN